ncbi:hypothetical protein INT47_009043 [Mucor saturninus]|uniref:aminodeoxychorismate synthase n=1 Tax=Mucor saturninus TaxID=64648 RepID=A0A8H7RMN7_9FUNG|nr:hypothetical protein INT47_009043 [Mucor saturninus]
MIPVNHIKTLIIDNYDSYTFNLLQLFENDTNVVVIRNDQFTWDEFVVKVLPYFDNVIISPGPGRPERSEDFGICTQLLQAQLDPHQSQFHRPIFGVCLGHQGIGHLFGGKVMYAPRIMHGRMSQVHIQQSQKAYNDVLHQCPSPFWAVRYHSLVVEKESLPEDLIVTAFCYENDADMDALKNASFLADNEGEEKESRNHYLDPISEEKTSEITIMAFQHKHLPIWGVQFHPESVSTEHGSKMMNNFQLETYNWMMNQGNRQVSYDLLPQTLTSISAALPQPSTRSVSQKSRFRLYTKTSTSWIEPESFVDEFLSTQGNHFIGWLDSSRKASPYSRTSILSTDPAIQYRYSTLHRELRSTYRNGKETVSAIQGTFFDFISTIMSDMGKPICEDSKLKDLEFQGGLMGYLGYEMKRESMEGYVTPEEQACHCQNHGEANCCACVEEPDAAFQFVDRFLVFDQIKREIHICCLVSQDEEYDVGFHQPDDALDWMNAQQYKILSTCEILRKRKMLDEYISLTPVSSTCTTPTPSVSMDTVFTADAEHRPYLDTIAECVENIRQGEAYEICLTTRFRLTLPKHITTKPSDPTLWRLYTRYLRKNNPAPFSALIVFPGLGVLSSSPERFLKVSSDGVAEMKPIKGTVARVLKCVCSDGMCDFGQACEEKQYLQDEHVKQQLWQDVKERAENLMIVDLIRNDLAQVCKPSSVRVPKLMHVESYEKVHHLVSTIRGTLYEDVNSVEAVKTCFPPGSMTGAPKLRSVQLLDGLEKHKPRGIYSGCLGYFSLNGSADFNVVIRTAVAANKKEGVVEVSVGGGGAITFLSDPEQEWKETLLKTKSVAPSVKEFLQDQ